MFYFYPFFKIKDPFDGRLILMCSHDPFPGTNKNWILKNGSCEQVFMYHSYTDDIADRVNRPLSQL